MPKGHKNKKKNVGVGVDFKRAKHKVGKKLPKADNATDTTVRSKAISLPEQSITVDKTGTAVTYRNLTLKDLLGQCGHYTDKIRLDALHGLTELLQHSPNEVRQHGAAVVAVAAERAADGDAACRAAFRDFLHKGLLPALGKDALQPFIPVLMAHICAAMTHLVEPIRVDALGALSVLMDWRADLVAAGYLPQVLQHFADALARPARGRSLKAGSLGALLSHVTGLQIFLSKATAAMPALVSSTLQGDGVSGGLTGGITGKQSINLSDGSNNSVLEVSGVPLAWQRCSWPAVSQTSNNSAAAASGIAAPARLLELLLDCWRECSPSELETSADFSQAKCATAILQCCNLLLGHWGAALAGPLSSRTSPAGLIIERISVYFPIHHPAITISAPLRDQLVALNVAAAQLLITLLPSATTLSSKQHAQHGAAAAAALPAWVLRLLDWLSQVMATGDALPSTDDAIGAGSNRGGGGSGSGGGNTGGGDAAGKGGVTAAVYGAALDAVAQVLPHLPPPRRRQVLSAAWSLWSRTSVRSSARARALSFFAAFLEKPAMSLYTPLPPDRQPLVLLEEAAAWVGAMPRFLWELGTSAPRTTAIGLKLLLDAARFSVLSSAGGTTHGGGGTAHGGTARGGTGDPLGTTLNMLQAQLTPLFVLEVDSSPAVTAPSSSKKGSKEGSKGSTKHHGVQQQSIGGQKKRLVPGPLASMPIEVQSLAVDLLYHLPGLPEATLHTIRLVAVAAREYYPLETALRLIDVASMKAAQADAGQFRGLLLTLLLGQSSRVTAGENQDAAKQVFWARHVAVVDAACRAALNNGDNKAVVAALGPPLLSSARTSTVAGQGQVEDMSNTAERLYGLISLCASAAGDVSRSELSSSNSTSKVWNALPSACISLLSASVEGQKEDALAIIMRMLSAHPNLVVSLLAAIESAAATTSSPNSDCTADVLTSLMLAMLRAEEGAVGEALLGEATAAARAGAAVARCVDDRHGQLIQTQVLEMKTLLSHRLGV